MESTNTLRVCCISDTHNMHDKWDLSEGGDILIHAGDWSGTGKKEEVERFATWLSKQKFTHKVVIAGNHEVTFDQLFFEQKLKRASNQAFIEKQKLQNSPEVHKQILFENAGENLHYLEHESREIMGYKFFGSPHTPTFCNWGFMLDPEPMREKLSEIPEDTQILISHGPPYQILDDEVYGMETDPSKINYMGCQELRDAVLERIQPLKHIFGHIHGGHGEKVIQHEGGKETHFINASVLNEQYEVVFKPIWFDLPKVQ